VRTPSSPVGCGAMSRADELGRLERELGVLIRRVRRVIGERARSVHPDLQPASYLMLNFLATDGPQRSSVVSELFNVDKGAISRQVQHLCDLGLLVREPDPADGRAMLISASPDAVRRLEAVARDRRRWLDEQLAEWTESDLRDFVSSLGRYNHALDKNT
jgi:DNA-binding MarR family transcriptional regulator